MDTYGIVFNSKQQELENKVIFVIKYLEYFSLRRLLRNRVMKLSQL
jgi:hypothetical protein